MGKPKKPGDSSTPSGSPGGPPGKKQKGKARESSKSSRPRSGWSSSVAQKLPEATPTIPVPARSGPTPGMLAAEAQPELGREEEPAPRRSGLGIALLVGGMLLAGGVGYQVLYAHAAPGKAPSTVTDVAGTQLVVESEPPGAEVLAGEQKLGKTPLQVETPFPLGKKVVISVRLLGVGAVDVPVAGGRGQRVTARLSPPASP